MKVLIAIVKGIRLLLKGVIWLIYYIGLLYNRIKTYILMAKDLVVKTVKDLARKL